MDEQANVKLIRQCYDSFLQGNIERLLSFMAPDIDWVLPQMEGVPYGGKRHGIEQVREFFQLLDSVQKPLEFHPGEYVAQGDRVVVFGHYEWALKSDGREFGSDFAHSFRVRHGQLVGFHEYTDTHAAVEAHRSGAAAGAGVSMQPGQPSIH